LQTELKASEDSGINEESPRDVHGESQRAKMSLKMALLKDIWVPIIVALIGALATITAVVLRNCDTATTPPTDTDFAYQVRVQSRDTDEAIPNAEVTIMVGGKAPLDDITDSNGLARIFIDSFYIGQPGELIVEARGYETHRQHIDLKKDALPDVVVLVPTP
jgi:hypothetical protein